MDFMISYFFIVTKSKMYTNTSIKKEVLVEKVVTLAKILVNVLKFFFEKHLTVKHSILLLSSLNERNVWQFCKAHSKDKNHLLMNKINYSRSFFSESAPTSCG